MRDKNNNNNNNNNNNDKSEDLKVVPSYQSFSRTTLSNTTSVSSSRRPSVGFEQEKKNIDSPTCYYTLYRSVISTVERIYFISPPYGLGWVEDEEQHTDWSTSSYFLSHPSLSLGGKADQSGVSICPSSSVSGLGTALGFGGVGDLKPAQSGQKSGVFSRTPSANQSASEVTSYFNTDNVKGALPSSLSPPPSPSTRYARDRKKIFRSAETAASFSSLLSVVVEDSPLYNPSALSVNTATAKHCGTAVTDNIHPVSPVRLAVGPVSALSQSLEYSKQHARNAQIVQNEENAHRAENAQQEQSLSYTFTPLSDSPRSPPLAPYFKSPLGGSFGPNASLNPSPSWKLRERERERDRDRGGARSSGGSGISALVRMQLAGGGVSANTAGTGHPQSTPLLGGGSVLSTGQLSHSASGVGGMDVKAMIGEARRRSDQRLNTDHQYLHRLAFACVRVGPTGFVWLSNAAGRVS